MATSIVIQKVKPPLGIPASSFGVLAWALAVLPRFHLPVDLHPDWLQWWIPASYGRLQWSPWLLAVAGIRKVNQWVADFPLSVLYCSWENLCWNGMPCHNRVPNVVQTGVHSFWSQIKHTAYCIEIGTFCSTSNSTEPLGQGFRWLDESVRICVDALPHSAYTLPHAGTRSGHQKL